MKSKESSIKDLKSFVDLCNRSIKDNEDILDYTKLFEKNRSQVESDINKATNKSDADQLTSKLEANNKQLKSTAKNISILLQLIQIQLRKQSMITFHR